MSTIDRSIRLDVSVPDFGSRMDAHTHSGQHSSLPKEPADPLVQQRFDEALAAQSVSPGGAGNPSTPSALAPLSLFGSWLPAAGTAHSASQPSVDPELSQALLERLMVDEGTSQGGGKQVRMALKSDVLPGVTIAVQEAEGRLQVDFICSVESSRLRLNAAIPAQAQTLAERLQRPVLLRVQTDDEEDLCLFEATGTA
jgi:hypothetical protein